MSGLNRGFINPALDNMISWVLFAVVINIIIIIIFL